MSTHKHFDKICCVILAFAILITVIFLKAESLGIVRASRVMGYENRLFDNSRVHTIDIVMNNWDEFIKNATSEEYYVASLIIDGKAYKNVGIRGKGNTSLSTVSSLNSERYSFKVEFDHYDNALTYHGLDKLSLNNLIQDSTMMKDFLTYTMMNEFGATSPLCSFVYITVNGEDWGLYLAVEGLEDSFLERNYGLDFGELYKPDSMSFGGGRGNGKDFNAEDFDFSAFSNDSSFENFESNNAFPFNGNMPDMSNFPEMSEFPDVSNIPGMEEFTNMNEFGDMPVLPDTNNSSNNNSITNTLQIPRDFGNTDKGFSNSTQPENSKPAESDESSGNSRFDIFGGANQGGMNFGGFGMGSSDVKLQYIDDNTDSYSNIWNNAKTDITDADQKRLIESLKKLSANEDIENVVDIEQVIRYFVVHNYVCNGDSYTGSMIHNYYLYEEDGMLSMLPWDYNLAYGTFSGGSNGSNTVNTPIDSPVSGGSSDRPMLNWIFENDKYTELYHQLFEEFLATVDIQGIINNAYNLISPYVEKDPTSFYEYEEFEKGVSTLLSFCTLRSESITQQLINNETVNNMNYVDASSINLSDMGSMGGGKGGVGGVNMMRPTGSTDSDSTMPDDKQNDNTESANLKEANGMNNPNSFTRPSRSENNSSKSDFSAGLPSDFEKDRNFGSMQQGQNINSSNIIMLLASIGVLMFGLLFAILFKRRR